MLISPIQKKILQLKVATTFPKKQKKPWIWSSFKLFYLVFLCKYLCIYVFHFDFIKVLLIISSVMLHGLTEFLTVLDELKTLLLSLSLELSLDLLTKAFVNILGSVIPANVYVWKSREIYIKMTRN